jgi:RNA polymerase sigma factor (sigma-70 family)
MICVKNWQSIRFNNRPILPYPTKSVRPIRYTRHLNFTILFEFAESSIATNKKLIKMMNDRDYNAAFQQLHVLYHKMLFDYAECFVTDAEDIVQNVFMKVHEIRDKIDITKPEKLKGLLLKIIHDRCIDETRTAKSRKKTRDEFGELTDPNDPSILQRIELDTQFQEKLGFALAEFRQLPKASRRVMESIFLKEMSIKEYARLHGISPQTGRNQRIRALKKIRENAKKKNLDIWLIIIWFLN